MRAKGSHLPEQAPGTPPPVIAEARIRHWPAGTVLAGLGLVFAAIAASLVMWLAVDQRLVKDVALQLHDQTVPWTLERQRLARNLEELRFGGQSVLTASDQGGREEAFFLVRVLAAHPSMGDDPRVALLVAEVESFLAQIVSGASKPDLARWEAMSNRLRLLADDLSVEGGQRMTVELARMTDAMHQARYKLLFNLILVAVFLVSFLVILQRFLIRPLQRIHASLMTLDPHGPVPQPAPLAMAEIHVVEKAIVRFHETLRENEDVRRKLERLATTDSLTGLPNRRHFMGLAAAEMARAARYGRPITVGIADLDHFKQVNDRFGHSVGDHVLQVFAELLAETLRQTDLVCRYGGEEFAFIFPETAPEEAMRLAGRLRLRLAERPVVLADGQVLSVTVSLGLADGAGRGLEECLARADQALYEAKHQGRDRIVVAAASDERVPTSP